MKPRLLDSIRAGALQDGKMMQAAAKAGIRPVCAETQTDTLENHATMTMDKITADLKFKMAQASGDKKAEEAARIKAEDLAVARVGDDGKLAEKIKDAAQGKKAVVFYGVNHGATLSNALRAKGLSNTRVNLYSTETKLKDIESHYNFPAQGAIAVESDQGGDKYFANARAK